MTETQKKYAKYLGKLYWSAERRYNQDAKGYIYYHNLVMIKSLVRRYGQSGKYLYKIDVLSSKHDSQMEYKLDCTHFLQLLGTVNRWGNGYFPATTGDLEKDVAQIQKAC